VLVGFLRGNLNTDAIVATKINECSGEELGTSIGMQLPQH
jgi:hypothetical protein